MIPTAIVTNVTVANDNESFAKLLHMYRYVIIPASASAFLIIASLSVLIMVVICIYQVRKRRRQAKCRNLERQYECVDEPIYEMIPNEPNVDELIYEMIPNNNYPKTGEWSDFNTNCNEAYQKSHHVLRYGSDTIIINSNN